MGKYVIATTKTWNVENTKKLISRFSDDEFYLITSKEELTVRVLTEIEPKYIFFPHWSWIIPSEIFKNYKCVVFHMTDLPYGRGGSPLQNLLVRGVYQTKVSAIEVEEGIDTGAVYFKESVDISAGNVDEILRKVSEVVFGKIIPRFIKGNPIPTPQVGEVVTFKRRSPAESAIPEGLSQRQIYDYIRMLDGEGYPMAYKDVGNLRIYFKNAQFIDELVCAESIITRR